MSVGRKVMLLSTVSAGEETWNSDWCSGRLDSSDYCSANKDQQHRKRAPSLSPSLPAS